MSGSTAEALVADLRAALPETLVPFSRGLLSAAPDVSLGIDDMLSARQCSEIMRYLHARLGALDRRAALSVWAGWHFRAVIPAVLAANILLDVSPRLGLDGIRFVVSADMRAEAIVIPAPLDDLSSLQGPTRFDGLVDTYLAPLIDHFAKRTGLTKRVLWSNAGHDFEGFLRILEPIAQGRPALAAAKLLLATTHRPNGDRNPLFEPVRYIEGQRIRRVCCMRYLFPDGKTCGACPMNVKARLPAERSASSRETLGQQRVAGPLRR